MTKNLGAKPKIKKSNLKVQTLCEKFDHNLTKLKPDLGPNTTENTCNNKVNLCENNRVGQDRQIENKVDLDAPILSKDVMDDKLAPIFNKCHQKNVLSAPKIRPIVRQNMVKLPERFSDIYQSDVVRLPNSKNLLDDKGEDIEGKKVKKKGRRRKDDGLTSVNVRSIRDYFSLMERTGVDSNGKRKLQTEDLDENKKMKVGLPD